jgi:hypothetical protein
MVDTALTRCGTKEVVEWIRKEKKRRGVEGLKQIENR